MQPCTNKELQEILLRTEIGKADISGRVMNRLYAGQRSKERFFVKNKVGVLVIAGMLLTASTGFAAVHYQSLSNKKGELTYQVKPASAFPAAGAEEIQRLELGRQLGERLLPEGTAAIFYILPHNPDGVTDTRFKPAAYTDLAALQAKLSGQSVTLEDELPDGYTFKQASVSYEPANLASPPAPEEAAATAAKLREQAEQSGQDYAMLPVALSDNLLSLTASYRQGDQEVTVNIVKSAGPATAYVDEDVDFTSEKLTVRGVDMIYTQYKGGNSLTWSAEIPGNGGEHEILQYQIDEMSGQYFSKEELVRLAWPFLN